MAKVEKQPGEIILIDIPRFLRIHGIQVIKDTQFKSGYRNITAIMPEPVRIKKAFTISTKTKF